MKIGFVTNSSKNILHYRLSWIKHLQKRGFEVVVFSPNPEDITGVESILWKVDRQDIKIVSILKSIYNLSCLLKSEKIDVLHTFTPKGNVLGTIAARMAGVKTTINNITGLGSLFINTEQYKIRRRVATFVIKRVDYLVFQNIDDKKSLGIIPEKTKVFEVPGSGIVMDKFTPCLDPEEKRTLRAKYGFKENDKIILYVGRLLYSKGIKELVSSIEELHKEDPFIKGLFIGGTDSGNPDSISENVINEWSKSFPFIKILGSKEEVGEFYKIGDVFAFPSYREGMPASVLEALSCNMPVITTDVAGCRQAVQYGKWGDIVPPRDSEHLAESLKRNLEMGSQGRNTRKFMEENFSISKILHSLDILYDDVEHSFRTTGKK
ncbi:MAG: glycosyltransferase family 4 protein [Parcubacteria group bacterium]|nr:glycosyltransferase family 4 protein [Parcubacteria group bacterium]